MNETFGCTNVLNEFLSAYKAERGRATPEATAAGLSHTGCPVAHTVPANQAACPVRHESPAHESPATRDEAAPATDVGLKVTPYSRLTALTAELWRVIETSPEPEIISRGGDTFAHLYYDGLSMEQELPHLPTDKRLPISAFMTVTALFEGYNLLVTQKAGDEAIGEGIERTLGGFDEGLLQLAMIFDALVQGYQEREHALIPPAQLATAMKASYGTVRSLTMLNYFPQKIVDELIVADINPFTVSPSVKQIPGETGAEVRAVVWDFLENIGAELFATPSAHLSGHHFVALFEYVLTRLHENVCGTDDPGRKLQGLMLELFQKVVDSIMAAPDSGRLLTGTPFLKQVIARLSQLRVGTPQQRYTQRDAVIVLQRTRFAVDIMDLAAGYRESPENRFTVGCTALRAGILKKWHARFSALLGQWYRLEYERQAASAKNIRCAESPPAVVN